MRLPAPAFALGAAGAEAAPCPEFARVCCGASEERRDEGWRGLRSSALRRAVVAECRAGSSPPEPPPPSSPARTAAPLLVPLDCSRRRRRAGAVPLVDGRAAAQGSEVRVELDLDAGTVSFAVAVSARRPAAGADSRPAGGVAGPGRE